MAKKNNTSNVPSGFRKATLDDFKKKKIVQGTVYYLTNTAHRFTIRPRLLLGMRIDGIQITKEESEEDYNDNYRKVILYYIKTNQLWIKEEKH